MDDRAERRTQDAPDDVAIVTQLDQAWNRAYVDGDRSALQDILSDDFVAVAPTGQHVSKSQLMQPPPEAALEVCFSEFWVRCWGATAATCGRIHVRTASTTIEHRFMRVYAKRDGRWQAVAVQVVPIPGQPPAQPPDFSTGTTTSITSTTA
jgi:ketosteroid isomerase-like protein